jgi:hypothetical protein
MIDDEFEIQADVTNILCFVHDEECVVPQEISEFVDGLAFEILADDNVVPIDKEHAGTNLFDIFFQQGRFSYTTGSI